MPSMFIPSMYILKIASYHSFGPAVGQWSWVMVHGGVVHVYSNRSISVLATKCPA